MRIGIDAKWFFEGPPSGKVVIQNLVEQLVKVNPGYDLFFFLDETAKDKEFPFQNSNIHPEYVWAKNNLFSNLFVLPRVSKQLNLDVLVYQNFPAYKSNYAQVAYIHDIIFLTHPQYYTRRERLYFSPLKFLAKRSELVCTVSQAEKERLIRFYHLPADKIDVIHHGVNPMFKPLSAQSQSLIAKVRDQFKLPDTFLLYVGRLNVRKNVFNLLEALPKLKNKEIPLVVVGGYDWKMDDVQQTIDRLNIKDRLIFTGAVFGEDLAAIYALAKVFCFPSFEESFGLPPLEAMASGIPVVVSNSSSIPEICGDAGNYVNANDPQDIARMIDALLEDSDLCQRKSKLGLARAKQFTWEKAAENLLKSCEKAVENRK